MIYSIERGMLKHGELYKGPCKKSSIASYQERYERDMRYMKRYERDMKERSPKLSFKKEGGQDIIIL